MYFVGQYYQVLQQQPDFVHQFYSEASTMLRIDGNSRETATTMLIPFQTPAPPDAPAGATTGPSVPPPAAERRGRQAQTHGRGRARGIRSGSVPSEPILGDDDDETSEEAEAASPQSESSEGGDEEGSGSGSDPALDSGVDGDSAPESTPLRKRTKRASRA
ncbi:hypothetical protein ACSBR2_039266 [Camellia fascicularis]